MRASEQRPEFAGGYVVLDKATGPSLRHAIGSRIHTTRRAAEAVKAQAVSGMGGDAAARIVVVPVEGPNGVWDTDHIDASEVVVAANGYLRVGRWRPRQAKKEGETT